MLLLSSLKSKLEVSHPSKRTLSGVTNIVNYFYIGSNLQGLLSVSVLARFPSGSPSTLDTVSTSNKIKVFILHYQSSNSLPILKRVLRTILLTKMKTSFFVLHLKAA